MKRRLFVRIEFDDDKEGPARIGLIHPGYDAETVVTDWDEWNLFWSNKIFLLMYGYGEDVPNGVGSQMDRRLAVNQTVAGSIPVQRPNKEGGP